MAEGPWETEPDRLEWRDEATDKPCLIVRPTHGALCGYVAVGPESPLYECRYGEPAIDGLDAHGGVTYTGYGDLVHHEIHRALQLSKMWWIGFDCAHATDYVPNPSRSIYLFLESLSHSTSASANYKTFDTVKGYVTALAASIQAYEEKHTK